MNRINYGLKIANLNSILNKQKNIKKYYQNHLCLAFVRNDIAYIMILINV